MNNVKRCKITHACTLYSQRLIVLTRITERSLYAPIVQYLNQIGFTSVQEIDLGGEYPDIEFWYGPDKFILEVKIGEWQKKLVSSIIQARRYAEKAKTENIILIFFPPEIRRPLIPTSFSDMVLKTRISALVLTKYWKWDYTGGKRPNLLQLLSRLREKIEDRKVAVSLNLVINTLRESVTTLADNLRLLSEVHLENLVSTVVGRFDLFLALGETAGVEEEDLKMVSIDLSSYLLLNQILFYHIYSQLSGNVAGFSEISDLENLAEYFDRITDVNYKSIYAVDVVSNIPRTPAINKILCETVEAIKTISPERVEHDLLGRLFHELLPQKTRKILAAFYTRPIAAEILAALSIDSDDETILDPACGSGTLLVSAYKRKMELLHPSTILKKAVAHTDFVENEISGIDIMPFASHLSAIHLASQNFNVTTNKVRIGIKDSLRCREGTTIEPFSKALQKTLFEKGAETKTSGAVSPEGAGESFNLEKVDVVIMNPPFTKDKRLPADYRDALKHFGSDLYKISGKAAGLWGYFLALASKFARRKVACVIPINILRGKSSLKLREHFLNGEFTWRYIVKATENYGFTEKAEYRDILLVIEKKKTRLNDMLCVALLKLPLEKMSFQEAKSIGSKIRSIQAGQQYKSDDVDVYWINHRELLERKRHLMPLVAFSNLDNKQLADRFMDEVEKRGKDKLIKPSEDWFVEGFRPVPKGLSQVVFITRPFHESREKTAFMTLVTEEENYIHANLKELGEDVIVERKSVLPSLRTLTGVKSFDIEKLCDYVIIDRYPKASKIIQLSKLKEKSVNWKSVQKECNNRLTVLTIARRINWYSPHVSHLAFYSGTPYAPSNQMEVVQVKDETSAKILALSFNSILSLLQLFMHKEESTGRRLDIRIEDLIQTYVLDPSKLGNEERSKLLTLFDDLKDEEFPGYRQQLKARFPKRVELDSAILRIIGFSDSEIKSILPKMYDMLYNEMSKIRKLSKD